MVLIARPSSHLMLSDFHAVRRDPSAPVFSMVLPPPNVTGSFVAAAIACSPDAAIAFQEPFTSATR